MKPAQVFQYGLICLVCFSIGGASLLARDGSNAPASPGPSGAAGGPAAAAEAAPPAPLASSLGISFVEGSNSTLIVEREGKKYLVDLRARSIRPVDGAPSPAAASQVPAPQAVNQTPAPGYTTPSQANGAQGAEGAAGADVFKQKCAQCHGTDGRGIKSIGTPDFTDAKLQGTLTDEQIVQTIQRGKPGTMMPAWAGKLGDQEISAVAHYVRRLGTPGAAPASAKRPGVYDAGDDVLMSLPTGRAVARHGFYVNFSHRFAFDPAFSGTARGGALAGLDGLSLSSFGFRYGVTDKLSVSIWRSPSLIGRPMQLMAAYNLLDEHQGSPINMALRVSLEGQNDLHKNFTENIEEIFSRSLSSRAQIYFVPTISLNDRPLTTAGGFESSTIPDLPGTTAVSLGSGLSVDIRPTVALVVEVIPTVIGGSDLGIHRPAYSFGIQKKIWRHAFTFGFTNSPGTTVSQRAGTRASFLGDPTADKPSGLVIGFNISRQIF